MYHHTVAIRDIILHDTILPGHEITSNLANL